MKQQEVLLAVQILMKADKKKTRALRKRFVKGDMSEQEYFAQVHRNNIAFDKRYSQIYRRLSV